MIGSISVAELSSPEYRGIFASILSVSFNLGLLFEAFLSAALDSYRLLNLINTAVSFCCLPTVLWYLESPYFLLHARRLQQAQSNLRKVRPASSDLSFRKEFDAIKQAVLQQRRNWWQQLRQHRRALLCSLLITFTPALSGNPQIRMFMSVVFPATPHLSNHSYPLVCYLIVFVGSLLGILALKCCPRRSLAIFSCAAVCALHCAICACCYLYEAHGADLWKWSFLAGNLLFMGLQAAIFAPLFEALRAEILPYSVKEVGNSVGLMVKSLALMASYKWFILLQESAGLYSNYAVFAGAAAVSAVLSYALIPETDGKTLAEVQRELENGKAPLEKY